MRALMVSLLLAVTACTGSFMGGMDGVLSLEDILEFILGEEIVDPHDQHTDMQEFARRQADRREKRLRSGAFPPTNPNAPAPRPTPGN